MTQRPLSDREIHDAAARLLRAIRRAPEEGLGDAPGAFPALSPADESRVLHALTLLAAGDGRAHGPDAPHAGEPRRDDDARRRIGSDLTPRGTAARATQGYGTAQGASGATSGGADPGGSVNSVPA